MGDFNTPLHTRFVHYLSRIRDQIWLQMHIFPHLFNYQHWHCQKDEREEVIPQTVVSYGLLFFYALSIPLEENIYSWAMDGLGQRWSLQCNVVDEEAKRANEKDTNPAFFFPVQYDVVKNHYYL